MNINRGVFRLWTVVTVLWLLAGCALLWNSLTVRQILKIEGVIVSVEPHKVAIGQGATDSDLDEIFDALPWNRFAKYDPALLAKHEADRDLFKKGYQAAIQEIPRQTHMLVWSSAVFLLVPFVLLALIKALVWIGRGFLSD